MSSGILNKWGGRKHRGKGVSEHPAIPMFEQLEPRLLLSADVSGLQLALPALDTSYEQTIEIDLSNRQEQAACDSVAAIEAIDTLNLDDLDQVISPIVTLQDDGDNSDVGDDEASFVCDIGYVTVYLEPVALSSPDFQDNQAAKLPSYENDILSNSEETNSIEIRGPPAGEIDSLITIEPNTYASSGEFAESSDVGNLYTLQAPDLPGLQLVDPDISAWQGQIIYLDFDGAEGVIYDGPVTVGPFAVPAFAAPGDLAGQEYEIINQVLAELEQTFAGTGIIFTTSQPSEETEYSTIYIGGDDSAFTNYGSFLGLAEQVDISNQDPCDDALLFSENILDNCIDTHVLVAGLEEVVSHEVGHLLGYEHTSALQSNYRPKRNMSYNLLSDVAAITNVYSEQDNFRFIAGEGIPDVLNTYYAFVDDAAYVSFSLGGMELTDTNGADGWSAQFNMSDLTSNTDLIVSAYEPGGAILESNSHDVNMIILPDWFYGENVEFMATHDWQTGYTFDLYCRDINKGLTTPADWQWTPADFETPLIDIGNIHLDFTGGWTLELISARSGIVSARSFRHEFQVDLWKGEDRESPEFEKDIWKYETPVADDEQAFSWGPAEGWYRLEFAPHFGNDLTWADGVTGTLTLDATINKSIRLFDAEISFLGVPFAGSVLDFGVYVDAGLEIDLHEITVTAYVDTDGNFGISNADIKPSVTFTLSGSGEGAIGNVGGFSVAKAGVKITGTLIQAFEATCDYNLWDFKAPGSLSVDGSLYWDTWGWDGEYDLFHWQVADWDFIKGEGELPNETQEDRQSYEAPSIQWLTQLSHDSNNPTSRAPSFSVGASATHPDGIESYHFITWKKEGEDWVNRTYWGECDGWSTIGPLPDGIYQIQAVAQNSLSGYGYSEPDELGYFQVTTLTGDSVSVNRVEWDDSNADEPNGVIEGREHIQLRVYLTSDTDIEDVEAYLSSPVDELRIILPEIGYGSIAAGEVTWGNVDFDMELRADSWEDCPLSLHVNYLLGANRYYQDIVLPTKTFLSIGENQPAFIVDHVVWDDSAYGDGDAILESGEEERFDVFLKNVGSADAHDVRVWIADVQPLDITDTMLQYPDLTATSQVRSQNPPYQFHLRQIPYDFAGLISADVHVLYGEGHEYVIEDGLVIDISSEGWLQVDPGIVDFGVHGTTSAYVQKMAIYNRGSEDLIIEGIDIYAVDHFTGEYSATTDTTVSRVSGGELVGLTVPAGGVISDIEVIIDTTNLQGQIIREIVVRSDGRPVGGDGDVLRIQGLVSDAPPAYLVPGTDDACTQPDISGSIVVWQKGGDILAYDLSSDTYFVVCDDEGGQANPRISGTLVAWEDNRNWDGIGDPVHDIFACDLSDGIIFPVATESVDEQLVGVDSDMIAFTRVYYVFPTNEFPEIEQARNLLLYTHTDQGGTVESVTQYAYNGYGERVYTVYEGDFGGGVLAWTERAVEWDESEWNRVQAFSPLFKFEPSIPESPRQLSEFGNAFSCNDGRVVWLEGVRERETVPLPCLEDTWFPIERYGPTYMNTDTRGDSVTLEVWLDAWEEDWMHVALLKFDMTDFPSGSQVISAKLYIYKTSGPTSDTQLEMQKVVSYWDEDTASSADRPEWRSDIWPEKQWNGADQAWEIHDLPEIDWVTSWKGGENYGLVMKPRQYWVEQQIGEMNDAYYFVSSEGNESMRPYLSVEYDGPQYYQWLKYENDQIVQLTREEMNHESPILTGDFIVYESDDRLFYCSLDNPESPSALWPVRKTENFRCRANDNIAVWCSAEGIHYALLEPSGSDMCVSSDDITLTNEQPFEGDGSDVFVTVHNLGAEPTTGDVPVQLYLGDPVNGGVLLGSQLIEAGLQPQDQQTVVFVGIDLPETGPTCDLYVHVGAAWPDLPGNNTAFLTIPLLDTDTQGPDISNVFVTEYGGDGDGIIGSDEQIKISWHLSDPGGIEWSYLVIDDISVELTGNDYAVLGPLSEGSHYFLITAFDADNTPFTSNYESSFEVQAAEDIAITYEGTSVAYDESIVVYDIDQGPSNLVFIIRNNGDQTLILGNLTVIVTQGSITSSDPVATSIPANGDQTYFIITPDTSTVGPFSCNVSLANSDGDENPFNFSITGQVTNINMAPTDIALSANTVAENESVGTTVGNLSTTDPNIGDTFTYSLVNGTGDTDNSSFNIVGSGLQTNEVFDYESKSSYSIRVRSTDQGSLYTDEVFTIDITDVNDAPIVITSGGSVSYIQGDGAVVVDAGLIVTDIDDTDLEGATISISSGYVNGEDTLSFTNQLGITGNWDSTTGILTLSGTSSVANYQTALKSITYTNSNQDPDTATRTVSFVVNDGDNDSNTATRDISVSAVKIDLDAKGKAQFYDADGDLVTVTLKGGGTGTLYFAHSTPCDMDHIELTGTNQKSSLTINTKGSTTIKDIIVHGSLKSIAAKTTDLLGDITADWVGRILMDDVADDHVITIGGSDQSKPITLKFDEVADLTIDSADTPIKSLTATEWIGGSITTPWISSLSIKSGDFQANVTLSGSYGKGIALNKFTVAGKITDSNISVQNGAVGTITTGAMWNSSCLVRATISVDQNGDGVLDLPDPATDIVLNIRNMIKKLTIKGIKGYNGDCFINSNIAAANINSISLLCPQYANTDVPFGLAADFIKKITIKDNNSRVSYKNLSLPADLIQIQDFEIRIV